MFAEATMQDRKGWAAFLALVVLFLLGSSIALAGDSRPVVGCFSPGNAGLLERLSPSDPSVRAAFDLGGCLALPPDVATSSASRLGGVWQLEVMGSPVLFYAPVWGAPVADREQSGPLGVYAAFAGQSSRLLQLGRTYVWCDSAEEDFARRWQDFHARWRKYREEAGRMFSDASMVFRRHYTDHGNRLALEADALQSERGKLERTCAPVQDLVLDERFVGFLRGAH
jgi:hypothetical protein